MPKAKKARRANGRSVVTYVRMKPEEHELIVKIAEKRGYPHTIASVTGEVISRGLKDLLVAVQEEKVHP